MRRVVQLQHAGRAHGDGRDRLDVHRLGRRVHGHRRVQRHDGRGEERHGDVYDQHLCVDGVEDGQRHRHVDATGISCGSTCGASFDYNTAVSLSAVAATGWTFTGWGGACTGTGACNVTMDAAKNVTATFTINQYTLSVTRFGTGVVNSTPAGISCGSTCGASFDYNTVVSLSAGAAVGYTFTGWGGACSGTGACNVTMDAAKSVTATFTANNYTLTVSKTGTGTVTSSRT